MCEHHHCDCCSSHEHHEHSTKKLIRAGISILLLASALVTSSTLLFVAAYAVIAYDVLMNSAVNITKGKVFDENFLMSLASIGALIIGEYTEGVAVMLLYRLGELLQDKAVDNSKRSIDALLNIKADKAYVEHNGTLIEKEPESVICGEILVVKSGERVPLDGVITDGCSQLDTSALTGESVPVSVNIGDEVYGGSVNLGNAIRLKVTKEYKNSAVSKILEFVEKARSSKPKSERFITKFAKYYTPIVVILAVLTMLIPPLFDGLNFIKWIERGIIFLVVSCPCALVISIPLGFFSAMGAASKQGILIKGGEYVEWLAMADTAVFDKTGTLTKGVFSVTDVSGDAELTLEYAAYCECFSNHPLARAIADAYISTPDTSKIIEYEELAGMGIRTLTTFGELLAGNSRLMQTFNVPYPESDAQIHIARDSKYIGSITVADVVKDDSKAAVTQLKKLGITTVMLTGDKKEPAEKTAGMLGIDIVKSELLPHEKAEVFDSLSGTKLFIGDGINDAPVISAAHVGFAMGGGGADSAIETADAVILTDEPSKVVTAYRISKRTMLIIRENIILAIAVKLVAMLMGFCGVDNMMWFAIFADVGTAILAIANSARILHQKFT